jgi:hypothetical protein
MVASITPSAFIIGPARVYYRAVGVLTAWTDVGVTLDDAIMRVTQETWSPDNLSGVYGPVRGLDVSQTVGAEIEFTLGEIAGEKIALAIPGATYTAPVNTDTGGTPLSTTTTAAVVAGATTIPLTAATNAAVGDYFRIEAAANASVEYRQITAINSLDISFRDPLLFAHSSGVAVVETVSDNRSVVTMPTFRRYPTSAYREWALVSESGRSGVNELRLPIAVATSAGEMTVADDAVAGMRVTIAGRLNETNLATSLYQLYSPSAA